MKNIVIVSYKRTAFGTLGGSLANLTATDLGEHAARAALAAGKVDPSLIDAVIFGNVCQSSKDAIYLARHVGLRVGVAIDKPALTVNRLCGSGFEAIVQGIYQILSEEAKCVLVGGTESMTQTPYVLRGARLGYRLGHGELEDFLTASLTDAHVNMPMAMTAERIGARFNLSRAEVDAYGLQSQLRHKVAIEKNVFAEEIASVSLKTRKGAVDFATDEHARPASTLEGLAKLTSLFKKDGLVTAGTASGICDGAAALVVADGEWAAAQGLPVLARIHSWSAVGCLPEEMGMGPVGAIHKATARLNKKTIKDFDLIEINEAFAAQIVAVERELNLDSDKTNIHGGAIAIGHPLAASGARLTGHLALALKQRGGGLGVASACIGGGQGMAIVIEV